MSGRRSQENSRNKKRKKRERRETEEKEEKEILKEKEEKEILKETEEALPQVLCFMIMRFALPRGTLLSEFAVDVGEPRALFVDKSHLFVVDSNKRLAKINKTNGLALIPSVELQHFQHGGLAVDQDAVYVSQEDHIKIFSKTNLEFIADFGRGRLCNKQHDLAVEGQHMYVTDENNIRIFQKTKTAPHEFEFIKDWKLVGTFASGIVVDEKFVWTADYVSDRIVKLDKRSGETVSDFGTSGRGSGQVGFPRMLTVDDRFLYVEDFDNARVQIFKKLTNEFVDTFTSTGMQNSEDRWDVCMDTFDSCVWVISDGRSLQSFAV
jgi:hypothetical protein